MDSKSTSKSVLKDTCENSESTIYSRLVKCESGEEIGITGISGVYPKANNIHELAEKLWSKEDLVSEVSCQEVDGLGPASRYGKMNEERIRKFDASFFKISKLNADTIDPLSRITLELAYEAIMDAGYNPEHFRGTKTGVFAGICRSDTEESWIYEKNASEGTGVYGTARSMIVSRIAFALGLTGPGCSVNTACSSSFSALDCAVKSIRAGVCDAAIVVTANLLLNWQNVTRWLRTGMLCPDGKCKTFSETANGYCRSEAAVVLLIQKKKDARRLYAEVVHIKINNSGDRAESIEKTSDKAQIELLREFYSECRIDPSTLNFVELHGTGTRVGDLMEANALDEVFCKCTRKGPLKVGSIKSNMGHTEGASGLSGISKAVLIFEREMIPPNLHFHKPRSEIAALQEGRIQVITELEPFFDDLIAITNMGFGGLNGHALLRRNNKSKINNGKPADTLHRLVTASGRTEKAVQKIFDALIGKPVDSDFVRLLHGIFSDDIRNHSYRGYVTLKTNGDLQTKQIEKFSGEKRPIWFIFRGMGAQYPTMGRVLLQVPITRESIYKSHEILRQKDLDLIRIITEDNPKMFDTIVHSFVGIAAIQIALVDLLKAIGISPDGMIGHSVGELGCAYADDCLTAEQTILAAYYRGKVINETNMAPGSMASVGLPYDDLKLLLPHDIDIACHNARNNYTISGPKESIKRFNAILDKDGIFVREVNVANIAYHSRYIKPAASDLFSAMKKIIPEQKLRSNKWICSSVAEVNWDTSEAQNSCAEYYVNNLKNCVLFEEACRHIPNNAITIEISPQGFFQSLIKQSSNREITNVPLLSRSSPDEVDFLFSALGRLYMLGVNPKIGLHKLYPAVSFPVGRGTPTISNLIEWNHDEDYFVTKRFLELQKVPVHTITVSLRSPEWEFIAGYMINGRISFPGVGYLYLAWKTFSKIEGVDHTQNSIEVENLELKKEVIISKQDEVEFTVNIQTGCGSFEIIENGTIVASGRIRKLGKKSITDKHSEIVEADIAYETDMPLLAADIYKSLRLRGYQYDGQFVNIAKASYDGSTARVKWEDNYITFLDAFLQIRIAQMGTTQLWTPTGIERVSINTELHEEYLNRRGTNYPEFITHYDSRSSINMSMGIEMTGVSFKQLQRAPLREQVTLQKIEFLPFKTANYKLYEAVILTSEIIKRHINSTTIQTLEIVDSFDLNSSLISPTFYEILDEIPKMKIEMTVMIQPNDLQTQSQIEKNPNIKIKNMKLSGNERFQIIIASNSIQKKEAWKSCLNAISERGFLLLRGKNEDMKNGSIPSEFEICLDYELENERILLCRQRKLFDENIQAIRIDNNSFDWIPSLQSALNEITAHKDKRLILYAENDEVSGIVGLSHCLFKEYGIQNLRCYLIVDKMAPPFSLHEPFYRERISKDMLVNIYKHGSWGVFCDFPLNKTHKIETTHAELLQHIPGDISSLSWTEGNLDPSSIDYTPDKTLLHVYYSELNFRDVMTASAKLSATVSTTDHCSEKIRLGQGCAGKGADGKRYMTVAKSGCFTTLLHQDSDLLIPVPDNWTLEEAATVPFVYLAVIYSFFDTERLHRGDSILIHSGAGGVGQAAIHIALHYGCTVFTTVGSQEKRDFIRKNFPSIPESHIGCSRDVSFKKMIMKETNGRGVDVVLNSLAEEKMLASVKCLAVGGRFIEMGLYDIQENNPLNMGCFVKRISFHAIDLMDFFETQLSERKRIINLLVKHLNNGAIRPLNRTVFDRENAEAAFRFMGSGKHIGKVLLRIRLDEADISSVPKLLSLPVMPQFHCSNNRSYVICGGLGGLGLELIEWLILRGARNFIISSRRGITTGYQRWKLQKWKCRGAQIIINTDDITKEQGVQNLLEIANALSPVIAIFNLAMVLRDALFENQTEKSFSECSGPKINATIHLDLLSRKMCPYLKHFVVFSTVSCGIGNSGQTNYCMANSVLDRICEKRQSDNLPGTAIQWGPMADVGVLEKNYFQKISILEGLTVQPVHSFLNEINFFLRQPSTVVRSVILNKIQSSEPEEENIFNKIGNIFGLKEMEKLGPKSKLTDYGMDSITTIEMKHLFERELNIVKSINEVKELTIGDIIELQNPGKINENSIATI